MTWVTRQLKALAIGIGCAFCWAVLDQLCLQFFGWPIRHDYSTVVFAAMAGALSTMPS